jgi:competence protein ComEC
MPPYALLLCSLAAVLATFASLNDAPVDQRMAAAAGVFGIAVYACCSARESGQLRALVVLTLAGATLNGVVRGTPPPAVEARTTRYTGTALESTTNGTTIALDGGATVSTSLRGEIPSIGDRVVVRGRLTPFDDARNPGEPSERALQRERGVDARIEGATLLAHRAFVVSDVSWPVVARVFLARAHAWAHDRLHARLGEPEASVVAGELWGERAALPPDLRAEFQETGTVHVLVTAGLHLGVVAAIVLAIVSQFALPRAASCAIAVVVLWCYVAWSGAQLPAERAAIMASMALAARACGRAGLSWNALAIAGAAIAFLRPESVGSASFALSFSCVGAIFALARPFERLLERCAAVPDRLREAVVLALATQLGTWPIGASVFLQFAPYALPANVAIVPCVALTMLLGAAQLALEWCAPVAQAVANVNSWLLAWTLGVVRTLSSLPAASIPMTPAPWWCLAFYDSALVAAPFLWQRGARTLAMLAVLLGAGWILWPPRAIDTSLRITVLDVGQADAIVVRTPGGHALLVDAGGRLERGPQGDDSLAERVGERIVAPFLLRSGIHALDALIVSHPHGDHKEFSSHAISRHQGGQGEAF